MKLIYSLFVLLFLPFISEAAYIKFSPEFPNPNENVKAEIILDEKNYNAQITWFVDDKIIAEDKSVVEIKAPDYGKIKSVKAFVKYTNKAPEFIERNLKSLIFDILYEARTYSHPLLQVSPFNSVGSSFILYANLAIPNKDTDKLIYVWKKDGRKIHEVSGQGKKTAHINMDYFASRHYIELEVYDPDTLELLAKKGVFIIAYQPEILLYLKDNLIGFKFNRELKDNIIAETEREILAIPFGMSARDLFDTNIKWQWFVNSKKIEEEKANTPYVSVYFKEDKKQANLKVLASYVKHILQQASRIIHVRKDIQDSDYLNNVNYFNNENEDAKSGFGI